MQQTSVLFGGSAPVPPKHLLQLHLPGRCPSAVPQETFPPFLNSSEFLPLTVHLCNSLHSQICTQLGCLSTCRSPSTAPWREEQGWGSEQGSSDGAAERRWSHSPERLQPTPSACGSPEWEEEKCVRIAPTGGTDPTQGAGLYLEVWAVVPVSIHHLLLSAIP